MLKYKKILKELYYKLTPSKLRELCRQLSSELKPLSCLFDYLRERKIFLKDVNRYSPPFNFQYYLSICAIVHNEAYYIAEWLEYHLIIGVEKFFIYDNESDDNIKEILKPYINRGIVEYIYLSGKKLELYKYKSDKERYQELIRWCHNVQHHAYSEAVKKTKYSTFWLAFIDIDEFIVLTSKKTIPEFLHDFENQVGIELFWIMYGSSGHINKTEQLVIERFQHHSLPGYPENSQKKMIVNPRLVFKQRTHNTWFFDFKKPVNSNKCINGDDVNYAPCHDKIRLNHYHSKSFEEWLLRRKGDPSAINNPIFIEEFNREQSERNIVKDDTIMLKYIDPVKAALNLNNVSPFTRVKNKTW